MLPDRIIEEGTLVKTGKRVSVSVRIPWYRALPLSSITGVEFWIDEKQVARESIAWIVNGTRYSLDELPPLYTEWWYVLDSAVIEGDAPEIADAPAHDVRVRLGLYIPYLPAGPGFIAIDEQDRKQLALREEVAA